MPGWIVSSFSDNSAQTLFCTSLSCRRAERLDASCQFVFHDQIGMNGKDLLPNRTVIQILPVRLLSALGRIDRRPTAHLGRARKDGPHDLEDEELETGPFAHDFGDDPARVGVVDDDFSFLGGRCGDMFGDFLDGVHFEELGEVVSGVGR